MPRKSDKTGVSNESCVNLPESNSGDINFTASNYVLAPTHADSAIHRELPRIPLIPESGFPSASAVSMTEENEDNQSGIYANNVKKPLTSEERLKNLASLVIRKDVSYHDGDGIKIYPYVCLEDDEMIFHFTLEQRGRFITRPLTIMNLVDQNGTQIAQLRQQLKWTFCQLCCFFNGCLQDSIIMVQPNTIACHISQEAHCGRLTFRIRDTECPQDLWIDEPYVNCTGNKGRDKYRILNDSRANVIGGISLYHEEDDKEYYRVIFPKLLDTDFKLGLIGATILLDSMFGKKLTAS